MDDGFTKYTPVPGIFELRKAISEKFKRDNNLDYSPAQIVVSNGAKQSIRNICDALLNPGDEVVLFTPYWVSYFDIIQLTGGVSILVEAGIENDYKVTPEQLRNAITDKTKFLLFSSPCNPTGSVYSKEELDAFAKVLMDFPHVIVVSDEIYEYINFGGEHWSIGRCEGMGNRTITVNGFSKGFAMTGWRLGYIGAPLEIAKACSKNQSQCTSGATAFGQKAAVTALNGGLEAPKMMREAYFRRKKLVIEKLAEVSGFKLNDPQGAFYIFPDVSAIFGKKNGEQVIANSSDLAEYLLQAALVSTVSGAAFGSPKCLRISYVASDDTLIEAILRIKRAVEKLK